MIIENILGNTKEYDIEGRRLEKIVLDRDRMSRPHQKMTSQSGQTYALSLPHGQSLSPGDVLYADEEQVVIVELAPEDALVIYPADRMEWTRAAYNIGNMHAAAFIQDDCIISPYDAILASVMQRLGIACEREQRPIDGVRAAASQEQGHHHHHHHHDHDHHHGHDHHHDHDHNGGAGDE